jgi:serine/threonine protein kinase
MDQLFLEDGNPRKFSGQMPTEKVVLLQLANGLNYIHSKNLVHRDIRPENVHIFPPLNGFGPAVVKWTGFGLLKQLPPGGLYPINKSTGVKGSLNWMPPEMLDFLLDKKSSHSTGIFGCKENDVFAAGCLFFAYLTGGIHPFGTGLEIVANIKQMFAANVHSERPIILILGLVFISDYLLT